MDAAIKAKWLEALRSGKYKQGRHELRTITDRFCCIGVLADVSDPTPWHKIAKRWYYGTTKSTELFTGKLSGVSINIQHRLADLNDDGRSFTEIADYIEREL